MTMPDTCANENCENEADDGWHGENGMICQECWEAYCADQWWNAQAEGAKP